MKTVWLVLLVATCTAAGGEGDMAIATTEGFKIIKAPEAAILTSHWRWLDERYAEAAAIKPGSTYGDLRKHFRMDGGLHGGSIPFRFVHYLAPRLKLDVTFERDPGIEEPDPALKIKTVSRPYLDAEIID